MTRVYLAYRDFAIHLARSAGAHMMKHHGPFGFPMTTKNNRSALTAIDTALNAKVIETITHTYPDHSVLAEEGNSINQTSEYVWVCDPLDGTRQFAMGTATFAFSLALVYQGNPVIGVIYEPYTNKLYEAVKGEGACLNGNRIKVSKKNKLQDALCFFASNPHSRYNILALAPMLIAHTKRVYNIGSCAVEGGLVASGMAETVIYANDGAHDFAAIKIIVEEAGGTVTDLWGASQRYDNPLKGALVSNGLIHRQLLHLVQKTLDTKRINR